MSRLKQLTRRRELLLEQCEAQRLDLAARLARLHAPREGRPLGLERLRGAAPARHPLAWVAALAGLTLLGRSRDVITVLVWLRTALAVMTRAAHVLRVITQMRAQGRGGEGAPHKGATTN